MAINSRTHALTSVKKDRRTLLAAGLALGAGALAQTAGAQSNSANAWAPSQRYPDPAIEILDPSFAKYRLYSAGVERLATGFRWAEGPCVGGRRQLPAVQRRRQQSHCSLG
jgi:hypothetical protein